MSDLDDQILRRLDLIQATLRVAFEPQLTNARDAARADDVAAAILDHATDWVGSGDLQSAVSKTTKKATRSVRDRLPDLVARGALEVRGSEKRPEYRRTGLI